jgi:hypothetical protein
MVASTSTPGSIMVRGARTIRLDQRIVSRPTISMATTVKLSSTMKV